MHSCEGQVRQDRFGFYVLENYLMPDMSIAIATRFSVQLYMIRPTSGIDF